MFDVAITAESSVCEQRQEALPWSHVEINIKGLCKEFFLQKSEITMEVGGWVQVSLGFLCVCGKSSQNSAKPVLIFWSSIPCVFCLYIHC